MYVPRASSKNFNILEKLSLLNMNLCIPLADICKQSTPINHSHKTNLRRLWILIMDYGARIYIRVLISIISYSLKTCISNQGMDILCWICFYVWWMRISISTIRSPRRVQESLHINSELQQCFKAVNILWRLKLTWRHYEPYQSTFIW